jgi:NADH:ubiquinone oxidoreductase subunit F (NADH-binding)
MTGASSSIAAPRLLAGTAGGRRLAFADHVATHGPLPLPGDRRQSGAWAQDLVEQVGLAGLTGRGGGGFPTAIKLGGAVEGRHRTTVVIDLMEGEPAAQKDSVLAAYAPHLILDGAEVLATALSAKEVKIAVAADNPNAIASLEAALAERGQPRGRGLDISVGSPPGRYVAGEESALVAWLDGGDARPTYRPSKPAVLTIGRRRAYVENAETAAALALIARHGGATFAAQGRERTGGTALVTVSGSVATPGVHEVAVGTPLGDIIALSQPKGTPTGILLGGYGGTFVGPEALVAPWSADGLRPMGGAPGAGVIIVFTEASCGVTEISRIADWMARESAGQCGPCAFGLPALADDLAQVAQGRNKGRIDVRLHAHLDVIDGRGACAHPDGVVRMVRSGLSVFRKDVAAHLEGRRCACAGAPTVLALPPNDGALTWR